MKLRLYLDTSVVQCLLWWSGQPVRGTRALRAVDVLCDTRWKCHRGRRGQPPRCV